jgi:hemolysin III
MEHAGVDAGDDTPVVDWPAELTRPLGRMRNPVRGFMDGSAAVASVIGLIVLAALTRHDPPRLIAVVVFALSLVALYTTSALYHCVPWSWHWRQRMQRMDHSMIFVLVAGSWTPISVVILDGGWRIATLTVVWSVALVGIIQKVVFPRVRLWFSITLQTTMGWFALVPIVELVRRMSDGAIALMIASGMLYTVGMILFATRRPTLAPRVFSYHEVFHVFVIAASALHFALVAAYVVPYGA